MLNTLEEDDDDVECDGLGEVLIEEFSKKTFFNGFINHSSALRLFRGDCVRIRLDEVDEAGEDFAFGQITAIFSTSEQAERKTNVVAYGGEDALDVVENRDEKEASFEKLLIEIRWLNKQEELTQETRYEIKCPYENELFETDLLADIEAGSIVQKVHLVYPSAKQPSAMNKKRKQHTEDDTIVADEHMPNTYFCRHFVHSDGKIENIKQFDNTSVVYRGSALSYYEHAYADNNADEIEGLRRELSDVYSIASSRLHVSVLPDKMPCRETETDTIKEYITRCINKGGRNKPMYVSGLPGTGKTACVSAVVKRLRAESATLSLPMFEFVVINGLKLRSPQDAYSALWKAVSGEKCGPKSALTKLQSLFSDHVSNSSSSSSSSSLHNSSYTGKTTIVCLVDELDFLMVKNDSVVYNLFDWPQSANPKACLIVVGIANMMDLPERFSSRVASRLKSGLDRIVFAPYSHEHINTILKNRLEGLSVFDEKVMEFAARRSAATAGDLRTALKICQRSIDIRRAGLTDVQRADGTNKVEIEHLNKAINEYRETPFVASLRRSCKLDQAVLVAICKHTASTGIFGMTPQDLWGRLTDVIDEAKLSNVNLLRPPMNVLLERLESLHKRGVLKVQSDKRPTLWSSSSSLLSASSQNISRSTIFTCRLQIADIKTAFKELPFFKLLP